MHGRIKTRTTAEQEEIKKKERAKKVELYKAGISAAFEKRKVGEKDESSLAVTAKLLIANPDIYTLWNIRREVFLHFKSLKSDEEFGQLMEEELRLTEACLRSQPKSYGTWHQRCWVLDHMADPPWKKELELCDKYLNFDERNFHCWDYRRFIVERSKVSAEEELKFTDEKIATNFSNYSAWHLRSNVLPQVYPDSTGLKPIEDHQHKYEMELVTNAAFTDPFDQSAWFYQRWLLGRHIPPLRIVNVTTCEGLTYVAFNHSVSPSSPSITVEAAGTKPWTTVDQEVSSYVWKCESESDRLCLKSGELEQPVVLGYTERPVFEAGFSPGVTEVLCNVLQSCQTLLDLEPDTKWPLLTSVLLMQAIDRKKYKDECLKYLETLARIDHLRSNYYSDVKSRLIMEYCIEEWDSKSDFSLVNVRLSALYHSQYLLPARHVDLSGNLLQRSLPRLYTLQMCQVLNLDDNALESLEGFPSLPNLVTLSLKRNRLCAPGDVETYIKNCKKLVSMYLDGNPLNDTHEFIDFILVKKNC